MHVEHLIKQKSYEHVVAVLRRDRLVFLGYCVVFLILLAIPPATYFLLAGLFPAPLESAVGFPVLALVASIYYLSVWLFFFTQFLDYYLDVWLVTNDRIVNIEQMGLFARTVSELDLYRIQDVTSEVNGFLPTMFNFGNVYIQTAGQHERFVFRQVPDPHGVRKNIVDLVAEDRKFHPGV